MDKTDMFVSKLVALLGAPSDIGRLPVYVREDTQTDKKDTIS
jgi:hypothetical protein